MKSMKGKSRSKTRNATRDDVEVFLKEKSGSLAKSLRRKSSSLSWITSGFFTDF